MGKVFTITEGLENMGALKTGGQGSVYKGRRIGEIITAIKLLPTPIYSESEEDKNFIDFQNEVAKLKKVNEDPNPHVVKILSSGVTDTGNFPFIEMEFIEGPDLEELLKPPHDPVFTIKETIKVTEQLASALAHCHQFNVKHGDIKSNNVKYNVHTGNYVLLDFGLAVMSDEQRRTSLRHAGAIEFMAPEQNEGQMLFQTDIYSFGVIIYELLAGQVPFPLQDRGETARNTVMVAHMETQPPDVMQLRQQNMPDEWNEDKRHHEVQIPHWLLSLIEKCLQKRPEDRFTDGRELHEYILLNSTLTSKKEADIGVYANTLQADNDQLLREKDHLQQLVLQYQQKLDTKDKELAELQAIVLHKDAEVQQFRNTNTSYTATPAPRKGVSSSAFYALLVVTALIAAFAAYAFLTAGDRDQRIASDSVSAPVDTSRKQQTATKKVIPKEMEEEDPAATYEIPEEKKPVVKEDTAKPVPAVVPKKSTPPDTTPKKTVVPEPSEKQPEQAGGTYRVDADRVYFHNGPNAGTRRNAYLVRETRESLQAIKEENGFIYVVFTNHLGQTSRGWIRKSDLRRIDE